MPLTELKTGFSKKAQDFRTMATNISYNNEPNITRLNNVGLKRPEFTKSTPDQEQEKQWNLLYAELLRREAKQKVANILHKYQTGQPLQQLSANDLKAFKEAKEDWIQGVRAYDAFNGEGKPLFNVKPRAHGRADGSTDGRLLRKLIRGALDNPHYQSELKKALYKGTDQETAYQKLNEGIGGNLENLFRALNGDNPATGDDDLRQIKKALSLTSEKLIAPNMYKQKYARVVPFNNNERVKGNKFVKSSRRFRTLSTEALPLPDKENGKKRDSVPITPLPEQNFGGLPKFGDKELIYDVGQDALRECWLQAGAASLPPEELKKMFNWDEGGVTVRLYDERNKPMYIRVANNEMFHNKSNHTAQWPFALAAAVAKADRQGLKIFRKEKHPTTLYNENGLPKYSLNDIYGNSVDNTSKLLRGKEVEKTLSFDLKDLKDQNSRQSLKEHLEKNPGKKGVVNVHLDPTNPDDPRAHAMTIVGYDKATNSILAVNPWISSKGIYKFPLDGSKTLYAENKEDLKDPAKLKKDPAKLKGVHFLPTQNEIADEYVHNGLGGGFTPPSAKLRKFVSVPNPPSLGAGNLNPIPHRGSSVKPNGPGGGFTPSQVKGQNLGRVPPNPPPGGLAQLNPPNQPSVNPKGLGGGGFHPTPGPSNLPQLFKKKNKTF